MRSLLRIGALCVLATTLIIGGCSSDDEGHGTVGNATYGTGPNHTRPYPQSEPVKLDGVGGAQLRFENQSRGGNRDYKVLGKNYEVWRDCQSYVETGTASWYGPGFHGHKTSNGEVYNQKGFSAAHKNLPLPSYLKVTNLGNNKAVIVRVNDRGPFHGKRIIDLSEGAARALSMVGPGTARVKIEYIRIGRNGQILNGGNYSLEDVVKDKLPIPDAVPDSYVQIFTTAALDKARAIQKICQDNLKIPTEIYNERGLYRVRTGPFTPGEAESILVRTRLLGYKDSFINRP